MSDQSQIGNRQSAMIEYLVQYRCPKCDSALPREAVESHIVEDDPQPRLRRTVIVGCEHCGQVSAAQFLLQGERWEMDGTVRIVAGRARRLFLERIGKARGDVLLAC